MSSMKGLLKGLRYIARIFEHEKEPEMQIGNPTDVKHVAHIGWEGASSTTPSWMKEFKGPEGFESKAGSSNNQKKERRKLSTNGSKSPVESPKRVGEMKQSKRKMGKLREQSKGSSSGSGLEISLQTEQSTMAKHSRQKKSKGSSGVCPFTGLGTSTGR